MGTEGDLLREFYLLVDDRLGETELRKLKCLLTDEQVPRRAKESKDNAFEIFQILEDRGHISRNNLSLLKTLLGNIDRSLVQDVEKLERLLQGGERVHLTDGKLRGSNAADLTASSALSSAAVHREITRGMQGSGGNGQSSTSLQYHLDRLNLNPERQPDSIANCQKRLRSYYKKLSVINPLPWWDGAEALKLKDVYTDLQIQTRSRQSVPFQREEIFTTVDDEGEKRLRILIEGDPGYGKSTFCVKLAYDWASGKIDYLNDFQFVFLLDVERLRDYHLDNEGSDLVDAIASLLFLGKLDEECKADLRKFIQQHESEVCVIFDGLDEVDISELPVYFREIIEFGHITLSDSVVIVTSRKIRDKNPKQRYDTQLLIRGFTIDMAKEFVEKHINAVESDMSAEAFFRQLNISPNRARLLNLIESPLNVLLLSDIWVKDCELPRTNTELYIQIVESIKQRFSDESDAFDINAMSKNEDLLFLGEISYRKLIHSGYNMTLTAEDISKYPHISKLGFLTRAKQAKSTASIKFAFFHLTFLEFFAAIYVASICSKDQLMFSSLMETLKSRHMAVIFIAGLLKDRVVEVFKLMAPRRMDKLLPEECLLESGCETDEALRSYASIMSEYMYFHIDVLTTNAEIELLRIIASVLGLSKFDINTRGLRLTLATIDRNVVELARDMIYNASTREHIHIFLKIHYKTSTKAYYNLKSLLSSLNTRKIKIKQVEFTDHSDYRSARIKFVFFLYDGIVNAMSSINVDEVSYILPLISLPFVGHVGKLVDASKICTDVTFKCKSQETAMSSVIYKLTVKVGGENLTFQFNVGKLNLNVDDFLAVLTGSRAVDNENLDLNLEIVCNSTQEGFATDIGETCEKLRSVGKISVEIRDRSEHCKSLDDDTRLRIISAIESLTSTNIVHFTYDNLPVVDCAFTETVVDRLYSQPYLSVIEFALNREIECEFIEDLAAILQRSDLVPCHISMSDEDGAQVSFKSTDRENAKPGKDLKITGCLGYPTIVGISSECESLKEFEYHRTVFTTWQQSIDVARFLKPNTRLAILKLLNFKIDYIESEVFNQLVDCIIGFEHLRQLRIGVLDIKGDVDVQESWKKLFAKSSLQEMAVWISKDWNINDSKILLRLREVDSLRNTLLKATIICTKGKTPIDLTCLLEGGFVLLDRGRCTQRNLRGRNIHIQFGILEIAKIEIQKEEQIENK
ncbi:uncharacterized protein LOC144445629 [Glandiceps talaboti]